MKTAMDLRNFLRDHKAFQTAPHSIKAAEELLEVFEKIVEIKHGHFEAVRKEVFDAKDNWPPFNSAHEGFAVLLEEVDELKKEVWTNQKKRDPQRMYNEAKQVAAMAIRFMSEVCDEITCRK